MVEKFAGQFAAEVRRAIEAIRAIEGRLWSLMAVSLAALLLQVAVKNATVALAQGPDTDNLQGQQPRMDFSKLRHDFGSLNRGQKVSHSFEFVNSGKGVLQVRSIHSSCGCVNTKVEPTDEFAPGDKGRITFEFDSSYFADAIVRTLTVDTNAQQPSTVTLTFTANIRQEVQSAPSLVSIGEVPKEFSKTFLVSLQAQDRADAAAPETAVISLDKVMLKDDVKASLLAPGKGPIRWLAVTSSSPGIVASLVTDNPKEPKLKITFGGSLPIGPLRERITVWNTSRHLKELVIPLVGEVTGHVKPSAKYLEFGVVPKAAVVRRSLTLKADSKDFKVAGVAVELRKSDNLRNVKSEDVIKFETEKLNDGIVIHFDMRYPNLGLEAQEMPVNASGVFVVRTNDPDYKEIRVPFFGVLKQDTKQ